jgi:4,5-DOPA dioxygenase extradiol
MARDVREGIPSPDASQRCGLAARAAGTMRMLPLPTLFLSHGSPMLALQDSPAGRFLDGLGRQLPRPRAIVVASAHYESPVPAVGAAVSPATVHDFRGFPAALAELEYPAAGDPGLASRIAALLRANGLDAQIEATRGLDHGVWVPLLRMYPAADIPVVPLAIDPRGTAATHFALGAALAPLRSEGVLVLGSGGFVHHLGELAWDAPQAPMPEWAEAFSDWMGARLLAGDTTALVDWARQAPHARRAHPTVEHLMPLFVALGAAGTPFRTERLHSSHEFGSLALDAFSFT